MIDVKRSTKPEYKNKYPTTGITMNMIYKSTICALALSAISAGLSAQTFTYDSTIAGPDNWDNSAKWDLPNGYPDGAGITVQIERIDSAKNLSLNGLDITVGRFEVSGGSSGAALWTIQHDGGSLTLDSGNSEPAEIVATNGAIRFNTPVFASNGVDLSGGLHKIIASTNSVINGGINIRSSGAVYLSATGVLGDSLITFFNTGSIRLGGVSATQSFNNDVQVEAGRTAWIVSDTLTQMTFNGNINGPGNVSFRSENTNRNDILQLTGNNAYQGNTTIRTHVLFDSINNFGEGSITFENTARTLTYAAGNTADLTTNRTLDGPRPVTVNVDTTIDIGANNVTYANVVDGAAGLIKEGSGILTLNGANTYQGATQVNAGTLVVNGDTSGATGAVTIATGASLGGSGTVGGATTVAGTLSPGNSIGSLTFSDDLILLDGSAINFEFLNDSTPGVSYDQLMGPQMALPLSGSITLTVIGLAGHSINLGDSFTIFSGSVDNFDAGLFNIINQSDWSGDWELTDGSSLVLTAIPEPSTLTAVLTVFLLGLLARRLRSKI